MLIINKLGFWLVILLAILPFIFLTDPDALQDRKTKLRACLRLLTTTIQDDNSYFPESLRKLFPNFLEVEYQDLYDGMSQNLLLTCFSQISLIKAAEIQNSSIKMLNPFKKENKALTNVDAYIEKYSADEARLTKDKGLLETIMKETQTEVFSFLTY